MYMQKNRVDRGREILKIETPGSVGSPECDLGIKGLTAGVEIVKENYWLIKFCLAANKPILPA